MPGMGDTLKQDIGPLPVWAWAGMGTAALAGYMLYRKKKQAAAAAQQQAVQQQGLNSNLGTVPLSNLTTQALPMPIQLGDTFVNTSPGVGAPTPSNVLTTPSPPTAMLPRPTAPAPSPAVNMQSSSIAQAIGQGQPIYSAGSAQQAMGPNAWS